MRGRRFSEVVRKQQTLYEAWRTIRTHGLRSTSRATRDEIKRFDADALRELRRIVDSLRKRGFKFAPQTGILKSRSGKRPRPVVVAAVKNRIVQRAILDVLQEDARVLEILRTPNSFGGIRDRGVKDAIQAVDKAIQHGAKYFIKSDIEDFFTKIPRRLVQNKIAIILPDADDEFLDLLAKAMETNLANLEALGDDANLFPLALDGVAQGSPLSPLMGNILLYQFDRELNSGDITCIRFVDDFVLLGPDRAQLQAAFARAQGILGAFGMHAYDPSTDHEKAKLGSVAEGFSFLGCHVAPGLVQPSRKGRAKVLKVVDETLATGRRTISTIARGASLKAHEPAYAQTLVNLDHRLQGWRDAFSFCNGRQAIQSLDRKITERLDAFQRFANKMMAGCDSETRSRIAGVRPLCEIATVARQAA